MSDDTLTPDGYRIVPKRPPAMFGDSIERGIQCGVCGMKFDHNKAYGFHCGNLSCPIFPVTSLGTQP